jgi:hypothetical protein
VTAFNTKTTKKAGHHRPDWLKGQGWTGIVARVMQLFATTTPEQAFELGKAAGVTDVHKAPAREAARAAKARAR